MLWDLNQKTRENYDDDLEFFTGYRNEADYPLAYNMTFPQLLPRIMTMLSRMLEQLYQGGTSDLAGVRPRKRSDVERAPRVQGLLSAASEALMNHGAFFSRPYGIWADMAFNRDAQTTIVLKKIKGIFDPNNVMNPGKLCFWL